MFNKNFPWTRFLPKFRIVISLSLALFILWNVIAYQHTSAMLNFTQAGNRTDKPEFLSLWRKIKVLLTGVNIPKPRNISTPEQWGMSFETVHFQVNEEIKLEAWYIPHLPSKGIILLFHSYAAAKASLLPAAKAFHEMGYETFLTDFRGSGGSNQNSTSIGYYEANDVVKSIEYVTTKWGPRPVILYGQSMGSAAILRAIYAHQVQPAAIILEAIFDKMLTTVEHRFSVMGVPAFPSAYLLVFWGGLQNGFWGFKHNPVEYATAVHCPVLILQGTEDPRVTVEEAEAVFRNLPSPHKQFERFVGGGHSPLATHPEQWKSVVSQFLAQHLVK